MRRSIISIQAQNLHWITDPGSSDLCAHGNVLFKVGDKVVIDSSSGEWCVSAAALYLLRTLTSDHTENHPVSEHLVPCCGHCMFKAEDSEDVILIGCPNGINWNVIHENDLIALELDDTTRIIIPSKEWAIAVSSFSDQVEKFYEDSEAKKPYDEAEAEGYRTFRSEWQRRRRGANLFTNG